ncbi:MAG: ketopantoate reductase family protein [Actinomycetota bacterium]
MRVLIAGTGGVGGYYGARLAAGGHDVRFLARGPMLEALRSDGLVLLADLGDVRIDHVHATDRLDPGDAPAEAVLFTVKTYDDAEAADAIAPAVAQDTIVCSLQNGVDNETFLQERFPQATVLGATSRIETFVERPGVVAQRGRQSEVTIGAFVEEERPAAAHLGKALDDSGVPVTLVSDIRSALWQKLVVISGLGGVTAYAGATIGEVLADPNLDRLFRDVLDETETVARALGIAVPDGIAGIVHAYAANSLDPSFLSSMTRDVRRGKPLEVESLNGAVVRYGATAGVPTPGNERVVAELLPRHRAALAARSERADQPPAPTR